jgi:hypothetical protein
MWRWYQEWYEKDGVYKMDTKIPRLPLINVCWWESQNSSQRCGAEEEEYGV